MAPVIDINRYNKMKIVALSAYIESGGDFKAIQQEIQAYFNVVPTKAEVIQMVTDIARENVNKKD